MESIKFYQGQENVVVIEDKDYGQSIFKEQYIQALLQLEKIIADPNDNIPSIIAFCGDRGEGKSSCMETVLKMMGNMESAALQTFMDETVVQHEDEEGVTLNKLCPHFQNVEFDILETIDPAFFDEKHNVLELVLGQMFSNYSNFVNENPAIRKERKEDINKLQECFHDAKWCQNHIWKSIKGGYDPIEELDALSAGLQLREKMQELVEEYLKFFNPRGNQREGVKTRFLVISIDDLDLNVSEAYVMAEQIRKYLVGTHCILMMSLKVDQLIEVIANYLNKQTAPNKSLDTPAMASKYLTKLIPMESRVVMPKVYDLCDAHLKIYKNENDNAPKDFNSIKEAVVQLIYNKTRFLFYNSKGGVSPIVPNNLRSLRHLLGMLLNMPRFEGNDRSIANKHAFKAYFYQTWVHQLNEKNQQYATLLTGGSNVNDANKLTVSILSEYIDKEKSSQIVKDITEKNNYSYNISVGDVFYLINFIERSNVDEELKLLLFFIKSYYSIRLYEYYDMITEQRGEMFPEPMEDGEVYRSDGWFKRTNQLQRFVNGSFFTYQPDDMLPMTKMDDSDFYRDLRVYSAKSNIYKHVVHSLKTDMIKYGDMSEEDSDDFKHRFRVAEMLALCTKKAVRQKESGRYENVKRDFSEPYYLTNYHKSTGYLVFDIMAPFYNIINLKYTYGRFEYLKANKEGDVDFYQFAYEHDWSLLRKMIDHVRLKEMNEGVDDKRKKKISELPLMSNQQLDEQFLRLISNASIRNADVLLAMMENTTSRRSNMHNIKDNMHCVKAFYQDIINSEMRTYKNSGTDAPYIIRFAFLEAFVELLNDGEESLILRNIYETGPEKYNDSEEAALKYFKVFFDSFKTYKKSSAIIDDLIKQYPIEMERLGKDELQKLFSDKTQYAHKDIAKILGGKMSVMALDKMEIDDPNIEE